MMSGEEQVIINTTVASCLLLFFILKIYPDTHLFFKNKKG